MVDESLVRRVVRGALQGLAWSLGLIGAVLAMLLLVNAFDEELNPEVAAYLQREKPEVADEQNGYPHLVGLAAPEVEQPHAAGKRYLAQTDEVQAKRLKGEQASWPKPPGFSLKVPDFCTPELNSCAQRAREKTEDARKIVAEHQLLLTRYRALHAYPAYAETWSGMVIDYPLPAYQAPLTVQKLFFVEVALRAQEGDIEGALAAVESDISLGRRMLAGSHTLIHKMVASRHLTRSVLFLADVFSSYRDRIGARAVPLRSVINPLTEEERRLATALRNEFFFATKAIEHEMRRADPAATGQEFDWMFSMFARPLYQPNATANRVYFTGHTLYTELDGVPAARFDEVAAKVKAARPEFPDWTAFYNPIGKIMVEVGAVNFEQYLLRMHDLDALVRLVALHIEIVAKEVKHEDVPQFLAGADKRFVNPYTGKPFDWDAKARQLHFQPRSMRFKQDKTDGGEGRLAVTL